MIGAIAGAALLAWGIWLAARAADALSGTRIGETRTPLPGSRDVELDSKVYTVFYEVQEGGSTAVPPLRLAIRRAGDGPALELEGYSGDLDLESGGRAATAIRTVRVPEKGRYRIRAAGHADAARPAVVLGRPLTARILRLLVAIVAILAGLALIALVAMSAIVVRGGGRRADGS